MTRINTNVASLIAQNNLQRTNDNLQVRLQRLSTGLRINRGADDPAGLIVSERLRAEIKGVEQAIDNAERASNVIATAEAALAEVAALLNSIKGLTVEAANTAGLSREEIEANQLEIDSAIQSISRIANTTSFAGLKLLNGSLDYTTTGIAASALADVRINAVNFGTGTTVPVSVEVLASAQTGALFLSTGTTSFPSAVTFRLAGKKGVEVFQFASGVRLSQVAFAVNAVSDSTGVQAAIVAGSAAGLSALRFSTAELGSDAFVSVEKIGSDGSFFTTYTAVGTATASQRDSGEDVLALINGNVALGRGSKLKLDTASISVEMQLTTAYAQTTGTTKSFTITGGGAKYQLGPTIQSSQQANVGIQSVAASDLGDAVVGYLSEVLSNGGKSLLVGKAAEAGAIIDTAITQVSVIRGRLGAFERNTLQTNVRSLQTALENITAAESRIRDADFARETSELSRAQILTNAGTSVLAVANTTAQNVLSLLQ